MTEEEFYSSTPKKLFKLAEIHRKISNPDYDSKPKNKQTTEKYIESKYQNKKQDVEITEVLKRKIIQASMNVIKLAKKGINIPFYDIIEMKNILLEDKNTQENI